MASLSQILTGSMNSTSKIFLDDVIFTNLNWLSTACSHFLTEDVVVTVSQTAAKSWLIIPFSNITLTVPTQFASKSCLMKSLPQISTNRLRLHPKPLFITSLSKSSTAHSLHLNSFCWGHWEISTSPLQPADIFWLMTTLKIKTSQSTRSFSIQTTFIKWSRWLISK